MKVKGVHRPPFLFATRGYSTVACVQIAVGT